MLRVEVSDDTCADGEAYIFDVELDIDKGDITFAIGILYPKAHTIRFTTLEEST